MTPPKVPETPKPASSVMINSTFGAPWGGTTVGGQYGFESLALRPMVPPNAGGGLGRYRPSTVVVALGDPGSPVTCWACAGVETTGIRKQLDNNAARRADDRVDMTLPLKKTGF